MAPADVELPEFDLTFPARRCMGDGMPGDPAQPRKGGTMKTMGYAETLRSAYRNLWIYGEDVHPPMSRDADGRKTLHSLAMMIVEDDPGWAKRNEGILLEETKAALEGRP